MNRRGLLRGLGGLLGSAAFSGCERSGPAGSTAARPSGPFSAARLHAALERLRQAFESRGLRVSGSLLPPLDEASLRERCAWFPGDLTPELVALYGWRGGQARDPWNEEFPFWFRDCSFAALDRARADYRSLMATYGASPAHRDLLPHCFPFASFNGGWLVLPTGRHPFEGELARPVVSVLEGLDVHYVSLQAMVDTCVDWVSHPSYGPVGGLPPEPEMAIWRKHNPGLFGR